MKFKKLHFAIFAVSIVGGLLMNACRPVRTFFTRPEAWSETDVVKTALPGYDPLRKTVFIIADPRLTEMFDMLAPFYLFNTTDKTNVYVVAKEKTPVLIKKDLFIMPQLSFAEADSMKLHADVIVIPAISARVDQQDSILISWIKEHFTPSTKMLTICDGAATGAATGLYDGKPITCHATDFEVIKPHYDKPLWVQNVTVARSGNLFSTAGVSNAVEGSLLVIRELFGRETEKKTAEDINYPYAETRLEHNSIALSRSNKFAVVKKVLFRRNRDIGILLTNGVNEFNMAGILDTYSRTFPASFRTFMLHSPAIVTKYGLTVIYKGSNDADGLDELHLPAPGTLSAEDDRFFRNIKLVHYDQMQREYLFNSCLRRIEAWYGHSFEQFVRISLDYN